MKDIIMAATSDNGVHSVRNSACVNIVKVWYQNVPSQLTDNYLRNFAAENEDQ